MRVRVILFAALAERLGTREEWLELPPGAVAAAVWEHYKQRQPAMGEIGQAVLLAVNADFVGPGQALAENDEVALLPPMSGGSGPAISTGLVRGPLPAPPAWSGGAHGAVVAFEGVVRGTEAGQTVLSLDYEAYEAMAERQLAALAAEAVQRWGLTHVEMVHRLGTVAVGEASVRVLVAAPHRAEAFAACRHLIDTLKHSVPIWKRELRPDGAHWVPGEAFTTPPAAPTADNPGRRRG